MALILRFPQASDEADCRRIHAQLATEGFTFIPKTGSWDEICRSIHEERDGINIAPGRVPSTWLVADIDGHIVGAASIRHALNDHLLNEGGHVGYSVASEHRRRGYATEMLRRSVEQLASQGTTHVLVTCNDTNTASAAVIERCGGVLEDTRVAADGTPTRRYWITSPESA